MNATLDQPLDLKVSVGGIVAQTCSFPFQYNSNNYSSCTNVDRAFNWCSPTSVFNGQALNCDSNSNKKFSKKSEFSPNFQK